MEHAKIVRALEYSRPGARWTLSETSLTWFDETQAEPTEAELEAAWEQIKNLPDTEPAIVVSPRQARLALAAAGLLTQIEALIASQPETVKITWEYAIEWRSDDPLIAQLAALLGLSSEQIRALFVAAKTIS